jgi:SAM-dependent methyltransferase
VPTAREVASWFDDRAAEFDDKMSRDPRTRRRFQILDGIQRDMARGRVLELGCATGRLLGQVPGAMGVDASHGLLREAKRKGLRVLRADLHQLPFAAGSFETVLAGVSVFRYVDYARALSECARVLTAGGVLSVHLQTAAPSWWRGERDRLDADSPDELVPPAARAGFTVEEIRVFRALRFWPHLVPLLRPAWPLWGHAILRFRRGAA